MNIVNSKCCNCLSLRTGLLLECYFKIGVCTGVGLFLNCRRDAFDDVDIGKFKFIVLGIIITLEFIFSIVLITGLLKMNYIIVRVAYVYNVLMMGVEILIATIYVPLQTYALVVTGQGDDPLFILLVAILLVILLQLYVASLVQSQLVNMHQQRVSDPDRGMYTPRKPSVNY